MLLTLIPIVFLNKNLPHILQTLRRAKLSLTLPRRQKYLRPALEPRHGHFGSARPSFFKRHKYPLIFTGLLCGAIGIGAAAYQKNERLAEEGRFLLHIAGERNVSKNGRDYLLFEHVWDAVMDESQTAANGQTSRIFDNATYAHVSRNDGPCNNRTYIRLVPTRPSPEKKFSYDHIPIRQKDNCAPRHFLRSVP
jgi:hypothetical protein